MEENSDVEVKKEPEWKPDERLVEIHKQISRAVFPEDLFGVNLTLLDERGEVPAETEADMQEALYAAYKEYAVKIDPQRFTHPFDQALAKEARRMLNRLYTDGEERIKEGDFGTLDKTMNIATKKGEYAIRRFHREGHFTDVYSGNVLLGGKFQEKIAVKILRKEDEKWLLQNEITAINVLLADPGEQTKHLTQIVDTFRTNDNGLGVIQSYLSDYYTLKEIRESERWKNGVPEKHMAWMLNRALSAVGYAHLKCVIHKNINPDHFMIRPRDHNLCLVGWSNSAVNAHEVGKSFWPVNDPFSSPEVREEGKSLPSSDLYSIGKCMIYILGGNIETDEVPDHVDPRIASFLKFFVMKSPWQRAGDAWEMHRELIKLIEKLWGPRVYREFEM